MSGPDAATVDAIENAVILRFSVNFCSFVWGMLPTYREGGDSVT